MAIPLSKDAKMQAMTAAQEVKGRSLWQDARRRLFRNKAAVVSMVILLIIVTLAILAPSLSRQTCCSRDPRRCCLRNHAARFGLYLSSSFCM